PSNDNPRRAPRISGRGPAVGAEARRWVARRSGGEGLVRPPRPRLLYRARPRPQCPAALSGLAADQRPSAGDREGRTGSRRPFGRRISALGRVLRPPVGSAAIRGGGGGGAPASASPPPPRPCAAHPPAGASPHPST